MSDRTKNRFIPVSKWGDFHPWPSPGGLRGLIFARKSNGFDKVVRRVGGKWLISEEDFLEWVDAHKS